MSTLSLDQMTIKEKLQIMEELWRDLCSNQDQVPVPQWHKNLLDNREEAFRNGQANLLDWETVKKRIADRIS
jgi:putative addiction module component (TIGR02574 family)